MIRVLGVLVMTSEYTSGLIRPTLTAVPTRLPVLGAKALMLTLVTLPVIVGAAFVTFLVGQILIGHGSITTTSITDPGVLRAVVGSGVVLTGIALTGLALGTLLRSTSGAISTMFAVLFLVPGLGGFLLPASWRDSVLQLLPSNAAASFTSVHGDPAMLGVGAGAAAVVLRRRSA